MKRKDDIEFVGGLQLYATPYSSLYYWVSKNLYFISVRLDELKPHQKCYAITDVTINQLSDYLNGKIGLSSILSKAYLSPSPRLDITEIEKKEKSDIGKSLMTEEIFDPDFCVDMSNILWFLWKHSQFDLSKYV